MAIKYFDPQTETPDALNPQISFRFLSELFGLTVEAAEVDNLGQSITLRVKESCRLDFVAAATKKIDALEDVFIVSRVPNCPPVLVRSA